MVELRLEGVTKQFGTTTAVEDLSLTVADGEFFTLVGPSGCGKTTTLRLVAGLERPDRGTIRLDGDPVAGAAWRDPEDRDVGVVFQSYALFPHMSVAENVAYGLRFRDPPGGVSRDERVAELLELVDMAGMGNRAPAALSGGQRQRVALARALAPGPGVLLLDEPMSALDARLRESLRREVRAIQRELSITTLYVTHDQEEAMATSDRIGVMADGRLEGLGRPQSLYRRPPTRFVASFLGESNLFEGRITAVEPTDESETRRVTIDVGDREFLVDDPVGETTGDNVAGERADDGAREGKIGRDVTERRPDDNPSDKRTGNGVTEGGTGGRTSPQVDASRPSVGDRATVCVRPESLSVGEQRNAVEMTVEGAEFLGGTARVWGDWEGRRVVVRLATPPDEGTELSVGFDPGDGHLLPG